MRKSINLMVCGIAFAMLLSGVAYGQTYVKGTSPQSAAQPCSLSIPKMVAIQIQDSIRFIVTTDDAGDNTWPKYLYPDEPATAPYANLWFWTDDSAGAKVMAKGSGNWCTQITLSQLLYAATGQTKTANGAAPESPWLAFTASDVKIDSTNAPGTHNTDLDYEFMWEATDPEWTGAPITLTYTVTANN